MSRHAGGARRAGGARHAGAPEQDLLARPPAGARRGPRRRRPLLRGTIMALLAVTVTGAVAAGSAAGTRTSNQHLDRVLDALQVPEEWAVESHAESRGTWLRCADDVNGCPSVRTTYTITTPVLAAADLEVLLPDATWDVLNGDCLPPPNSVGIIRTCSQTTVVEGFRVSIDVRIDALSETVYGDLAIEPVA